MRAKSKLHRPGRFKLQHLGKHAAILAVETRPMRRKLFLGVLIVAGGLAVGYFAGGKFAESQPAQDGESPSSSVAASAPGTGTLVTEMKPKPMRGAVSTAFAQQTDDSSTNNSPLIAATPDPNEPGFLRQTCQFYASATNIDLSQVFRWHVASVKDLPPTLTPEERKYRLDVENKTFFLWGVFHHGMRLRLSDGEYKQLFLNYGDLQLQDGFVNRFPPDAEDKIKKVLSPDTYQDYLESKLIENELLTSFANAFDLSDDTFAQIRALRESAPRNSDREAFQAYSNSVSVILDNGIWRESRRRQAINEFFGNHLLFMRPHKPK
jgi:hypothetical protein